MATKRAYGWRHHRIAEVSYDPLWQTYSVRDDVEPGTIQIDAIYQVTPRAGDTISYYGDFPVDGLIIGCPIEVLVIGERVIWDERERLHTGTEETSQP